MSFRTRFILLALFNCVEVLAVLWLPLYFNIDLSQRLVDLQLDTKKGLLAFSAFLGVMAIAFLVNFLLMTSRKSEFTYEQVGRLMQTMSNTA